MLILFAKKFKKKYWKLQIGLQRQCDERLHLFESEPFHDLLYNHALNAPYSGCRSINVTGDYRAIFYYESEFTVRFIDVDTHHNLFGT